MSKMPVVFVGHGSPMNIIEENSFTRGWAEMAQAIPRPRAILCVSAHWFISGNAVSVAEAPATIYDFSGFPRALYAMEYPAPGAPALAKKVQGLWPEHTRADAGRGLDHGAWSVLRFMYPAADIPVFQCSVNADNTPAESYALGQRLAPLREEGVLILGSGNIVHNLALIGWDMPGGLPWADDFDAYIRAAVLEGRHEAVMEYGQAGLSARMAFHQRDHYDPLLYALGAAGAEGPVRVYNDARTLGSLSMTSYILG